MGPGGCLITSDRPLQQGLSARILLDPGPASAELAASGTVVRACLPLCSIAFGRGAASFRDASAEWFRRLLAADPRLRTWAAQVPLDLDLDSRVFLMNPPSIIDLSPEEAALVGHARQGVSIEELLSRAGAHGSRSEGILFGLFQKRIFTVLAAEAGDASRWRRALASAGYAVPLAAGAAKAAPEAIRTVAHASAAPVVAVPSSPGHRTSAPAPAAPLGKRGYERSTGAVVNAQLLRGVESSRRSPEAEAVFARARAAADAGRAAEAVQLLREALALAPQDRDIAAMFARVAFRR